MASTRPRAPTITVDTSNVSEVLQQHANPQSTNPNSLLLPPSRARGDSLDSHSSSQFSTGSNTSTAISPDSPPDRLITSSHSSYRASDATHVVGSIGNSIPPEDQVFTPESEDQGKLFQVDGENPFGVTPGHLSKLVGRKSLEAFYHLRGLGGLSTALRTDPKSGLNASEDQLKGTIQWEDVKAARGYQGEENGTSDPKQIVPRRTTTGSSSKANLPEGGFSDRKRIFGNNTLPEKKRKSILQLAWIALHDKLLIVLCVAAVVSLALGIYTSVTKDASQEGARIDWVEGVAIMVAISVVVFVGAANDWQKERQFAKLNRQKEDRTVWVKRSGKTVKASVYDIYPGDVMILEQGDVVPADGIFINGHNLSCDESAATGESDVIRKTPGDAVLKALDEGHFQEGNKRLDPFIVSGSKISEGVGTYMITAVGVNSEYGKTMMAVREDNVVTPLQQKLNRLAGQVAYFGAVAGLLLFTAMFIIFLATLNRKVDGKVRDAKAKGQDFIQVFILAISIVVVAIPEGLPLAVTLALAFATKRMTKDQNLVRHLQSCETMGNATVICSDKTGTLTQNEMTVVSSAFGKGTIKAGDGSKYEHMRQQNNAQDQTDITESPVDSNATTVLGSSGTLDDVTITMNEIPKRLPRNMQLLLKDSIICNSTAFEEEGVEEVDRPAFTGSKTETALLYFAAQYLGMGRLSNERDDSRISQLYPFDSKKKSMGVVVRTEPGKYRLYVKGAPEIILSKCKWVIKDPIQSLDKVSMADDDRRNLRKIISTYASMSLRTIALAYKDFDNWPPEQGQQADQVEFESVFNNLIWTAVVGIQDPVRPGVPEAVKDCERAGVKVVMVTGDNVETAKAIAKDCGILKDDDGVVLQGPQFRMLPDAELEALLPKLCVLARSSPEDKKTLVKAFKARGDVVAVTGDGTNDAPALKAADVGFSMGKSGTEVAKEASDIILMDDNFASTVKALAWGRTVNDAVKKFLQFQLTVNITAVLLTFVSAVASAFLPANQGEEESVINAVQLLWVNLIMDTFAALALATDSPSRSMLDRKPEKRDAPLITVTMWKMIWVQALLQMFVCFFLYFAGTTLPHIEHWDQRERNTLVFNTFVWMQIFNAINCRRIDNNLNIFEGLWNNWIFLAILGVMISGQVLIVFVGGAAFTVERIDGVGWAISIIVGILSLPLGVVARMIPDRYMAAVMTTVMRFVPKMPKFRRRQKSKDPEIASHGPEATIGRRQYSPDWNAEIAEKLQDDLKFYRQLRGRRLALLKQGLRHPKELPVVLASQHGSATRSRSGSRHSVLTAVVAPGAMAMASGIGGGSSHGNSGAVTPVEDKP